MRAPHGAGDPRTGPEGFERWWGSSYPKPHDNWREGVLELWVAQDLEGEADEIIRYTDHQRRSRQWRQRGPKGEPFFYVPVPWRLFAKGEWRKPGPWSATPAAPARLRSSGTQPQVVDMEAAGMVNVTGAHGWLLELLSDADIDEATKERHRRDWLTAHPGQRPPWAQQPNGRSS